ncbi:MAG: hypothetical protein AAGF15_09990, partial [Pseudomonadota bacterium]
MERLDTNNDGKLSPEEMTARRDPAKMLERLDTALRPVAKLGEFLLAQGAGAVHVEPFQHLCRVA